MIRTVVLDLDGPVLDGRLRHHACYAAILREHGRAPMDLHRYWRMKRRGIRACEQLAATGAADLVDVFTGRWLELIESPELLALDRVQRGARAWLRRQHADGVRIVVATLRRNADLARAQLSHLGIESLVDSLVVVSHDAGATGKAACARAAVASSGHECLWIGDTEVDVAAARELGCPVWLVANGLREGAYLRRLAPDFLSDRLARVDLGRVHGVQEPGH